MNTTQDAVGHVDKLLIGLMAATVALLLEAFLWGFTVDDAWIVARVAAHGAETGIFAFNRGGPVTDAVTPFGWAHLLGLGGRGLGLQGVLEFWALARWLGCVAYGLSFFIAGYVSGTRLTWREWWRVPLLTLLSVPAAIWAGAGLTTPIVGLLIVCGAYGLTTAECRTRKVAFTLALGMAGAWRPELIPFVAALLICSAAFVAGSGYCRCALLVILAAPTGAVMSCRFILFDHPLPLSSLAKTPSFENGLFYAAVTLLWAGLPWLLLLKNAQGQRWRAGLGPWLLHLASLVFVGGDWMPGLRLCAALYPWLVWQLAARLTKPWAVVFVLAVAVFPGVLIYQQGSDLRAVASRRLALIEQMRPLLKSSQVIAAVDIGWLGVATDSEIVDLAGVTDAKIAALPGGHTSKAVYPGLFSGRDVDTWLVRTADADYQRGDPVELIQASYWVDARLLSRSADLGMRLEDFLPLPGTAGGYALLRLDQ